MKLFDGIHKFVYQTVFGKVQLVKNDNGVTFKLLDVPNISHSSFVVSDKFHLRRFDNRMSALKKLKQMERQAIEDMEKLLREV